MLPRSPGTRIRCSRWAAGSSPPVDDRRDLTLLGKTVETFLGENQVAVVDDLEDTPARGLEIEVLDLAAVGVDKLFRQTDGIGGIVSNDAELDRDVHLHSIPVLFWLWHTFDDAGWQSECYL